MAEHDRYVKSVLDGINPTYCFVAGCMIRYQTYLYRIDEHVLDVSMGCTEYAHTVPFALYCNVLTQTRSCRRSIQLLLQPNTSFQTGSPESSREEEKKKKKK